MDTATLLWIVAALLVIGGIVTLLRGAGADSSGCAQRTDRLASSPADLLLIVPT